MSIRTLVGLRIKELRNKSDLTQAELAEIVGIDPKHQSCVENGRNFPSADLIEKYAEALNVDAPAILDIKHVKDRKTLLKDINNAIKTASDKDIVLIHRIIFDILK